MVKRELECGHELEAEKGKELILTFRDTEAVRTKRVFIPTGETLNKWVEAEERPKEPEPDAVPTTEDKIEALELEIERLKKQLISK